MSDSSDPSEGHSEEDDSNVSKVPWYEKLEDLGRKEEGCLYRLRSKPLRPSAMFYDQNEDVSHLEDRVGFRCFQKVPFVVPLGWEVCYIHLTHREVSGWYLLKFDTAWKDMLSQGRGHCFVRAESNRFAVMAMGAFRRDLYNKIENAYGAINLVHQQWYSNAASMASSGSKYEDEPRWMICEGLTDEKSHRFVYENRFDNEPMVPYTWNDLIYAFVHFAYDISGGRTLISNLECDARGRITNIQRAISQPQRSRDGAEGQRRV
ncbi:uncharacterized protein MELLADRAFT_64179 [Melampsora larici-populina 98AG31]|uniref:Alpha-type protein kinase domain-containing protein n=1 Tax=Melampsora larici-populina (strain 98AG31 / pathotype 3-4-7) TaxID=747676 RepID=F4RQA5_MELLP|nr:uncharacterized protein MELLADRAFT_64179 [Melampsora larici-populina 98AG31]EGG05438.1 hypothetical protein MELLADRAFT_64179 [Melampsora larici-populina 98AG31]